MRAGAGRHFLGDFVDDFVVGSPPDCAAPGWKLGPRGKVARGGGGSRPERSTWACSSRQKRWGGRPLRHCQCLRGPPATDAASRQRSAQLVRGNPERVRIGRYLARWWQYNETGGTALRISFELFARVRGSKNKRHVDLVAIPRGRTPPHTATEDPTSSLHEEVTHIESTATRCQRGSHGTSRAPLE